MGHNTPLSKNGVLVNVKRVAVPPQEIAFFADVALLQLDRPVKFSNSIYPICIPTQPSKPQSNSCTVTGRGRDDKGGKLRNLITIL